MFCGFPPPQKAIYTNNLSILLLMTVQLIFLILRISIKTTTKKSIKPALNVGRVISYCPSSFLVVQRVKHPPAKQKTWVRSLGQEDPLEKEIATHSCILTWRIPWTQESGGLQSMGSQRVGHDWMTNTYTISYLFFDYVFFDSNSLLT